MQKKVLLDTNFIITCIENKIDFITQLKLEGFSIFVPDKVIKELETMKSSKRFKISKSKLASIGLNILNKNAIIISLKGAYADKAIINFAREHPEFHVATLDKELRKKIKNKIGIRKASKSINLDD